jgi:hypothetical protein
VSALQMALAEQQGILAPVESLARLPANPIADLVAHDCAHGNKEQEFSEVQLPGGGEYARRDEEGIARKKKSDKETRFYEDDGTHE